ARHEHSARVSRFASADEFGAGKLRHINRAADTDPIGDGQFEHAAPPTPTRARHTDVHFETPRLTSVLISSHFRKCTSATCSRNPVEYEHDDRIHNVPG